MRKRYLFLLCAIVFIYAERGDCFNFLRMRKPENSVNICSLSPDSGRCSVSSKRYFHNTSSNKCETFIYGGCGGNENNFRTEQQCMLVCNEPKTSRSSQSNLVRFELTDFALKDDCDLPMDSGLCYASFRRFYFNGNKCEAFIYGGCGGNRNNFETKEQCARRCGVPHEIGSGEEEEDDDLFLTFIEF